MAGQDIRKLVPAGGGFPIQVSGDYIYLKFADRAIDVIINGGRSGQTRVNMEAGDKYRPGPFEAFEVVNPDPDNAAQVIFTVGEGDYNRQIVQGEISVIPGIRKADGSWASDERWDLKAAVSLTNVVPKTFTRNVQVKSVSTSQNMVHLAYFPDSQEMIGTDFNGYHRRYDLSANTSSEVGNGVVDIGPYEVRAFKGALDGDGNTWITGRRESDGKAAAIQIDRNLQVQSSVVAPIAEWNFANDSATTAVCFDESGVLYLVVPTTAYRVNVYRLNNGNLDLIGTLDETADYAVARHFHIEDGKLVWARAGGSNPYAAFTLPGLNKESANGLVNLEYGGMLVPSERIYWKAEATQNFRAYAIKTWTKTAEGVFTTCASGYLFRPEVNITEAGITAEVDSQGRVLVRGQIIRAMLELYLGGFVADDYLNHVYAVTFDNEGGRAPRTVTSGNTTFSGAKIADNFSAFFPQSVTITLDNGLTTKD